MKKTDVHTAHCCVIHGCKYGDGEKCSVKRRDNPLPQEWKCEWCDKHHLELDDAQVLALAEVLVPAAAASDDTEMRRLCAILNYEVARINKRDAQLAKRKTP